MDTVTKLTNELVASYARVGGINHLDGKNLPSNHAIVTITQNLLRLLFPGFFGEKPIHSSEIKVTTAELLDSIVGLLREQRSRIFNVDGGPQRGQHHHKRILAAIEKRDPDKAREAMRAHLKQVLSDSSATGKKTPRSSQFAERQQPAKG